MPLTNNQLSIDEIKHNFPAFIQRIEEGEILVISKEGKPLEDFFPCGFLIRVGFVIPV
ncbi:hypothetical protein H8E88_25230 [candidate division KSB1 bacterium]|nr:hypothetical protein [candidate division KSB1 bacterium]